jgi:hypothetical protein
LGLQEMLGDEITQDLRAVRDRVRTEAIHRHTNVSRELVSKGIRYGVIRAKADGTIDTSGVRGVNPDLRVRPFFAQGGTDSIREFVVGALNDEMGLQAVDPVLAAAASGQRVVSPSGMVFDGSKDQIQQPLAKTPNDDPDNDGVRDEIPTALVDYLEFYLLNYFKPATYRETPLTQMGNLMMKQIGCTSCHMQDLRIEHDRRVADVETVYDPRRGIFNGLYATASLLVSENDDGSGYPSVKTPLRHSFVVRNFFADLKRHDVGPAFYERNYNGTLTKEFMTRPLWGVATTAPYGHDGRSINLREVILRHGGEAQASRNAFARLPEVAKAAILEFLGTLVLFPPEDTASNLDPGDPQNPSFPQRGHGSISLQVLFNDPSDAE